MLSLGSLGGSWGLLGKVLGGHWESLEGLWGLGRVLGGPWGSWEGLEGFSCCAFWGHQCGEALTTTKQVKIEIVKQM